MHASDFKIHLIPTHILDSTHVFQNPNMSNLTINTGIGAMQYVLANRGHKAVGHKHATKKDAGPLSPAAHVVHWDRRLRAGIG